MDLLLHQTLSGLATGGIYASVALALVMIYQATHLVNFAQGELAMFATYICWSLIQAGLPYWVAFLATIVIAFIGGVLIQRVIMWPLRNAPVLSLVIVFIGLLVIFNSVAGWIFTYTIKPFPSPFPEKALFDNSYIGPHELGSICVTLVVLGLVFAFFRFTPLGLAMRAAGRSTEGSLQSLCLSEHVFARRLIQMFGLIRVRMSLQPGDSGSERSPAPWHDQACACHRSGNAGSSSVPFTVASR